MSGDRGWSRDAQDAAEAASPTPTQAQGETPARGASIVTLVLVFLAVLAVVGLFLALVSALFYVRGTLYDVIAGLLLLIVVVLPVGGGAYWFFRASRR